MCTTFKYIFDKFLGKKMIEKGFAHFKVFDSFTLQETCFNWYFYWQNMSIRVSHTHTYKIRPIIFGDF